MKKQQTTPKWFDGFILEEPEIIANPYSGESVELNPLEVAIYDLCKGAEMCQNYGIMRKCLDWFRKNNADAYMTLLD